LAVVVTVAKGYDLGYIWKTRGEAAGRVAGGYYLNAAQAGEPPGRWWGPGARALGFAAGQVVQRTPYEAVYQQIDARALAKALILISAKHPAWTRHDLVKQLALVMPADSRQMSPQAAQELLLGLAEEALSGRTGQVVSLEAPEWPPLPASLRRQLDGRSVYTRPGAARYATTAQLTTEEQLVAHAQTQGAPRLPGEVAARRLGTDLALLEAQLHGRPYDARERAAPRGLRLDQAAAVWHVLTSPRTVEVITGPAGTGKTRVLATAASVWNGPVFGTATSQNATNELRAAGVQVAANTTRLLADLAEGRIPPGSLIMADEGSMISAAHLAVLTEYAACHGCKPRRPGVGVESPVTAPASTSGWRTFASLSIPGQRHK
jgi:AAA domain